MMSDIINIKEFYSVESRLTIVENSIINMDKNLIEIKDLLRQTKNEIRDDLKETRNELTEAVKESRRELKGDNRELKSNIRGNLFWTLGCILGIYGTAFVTLISAVGKAYHWF